MNHIIRVAITAIFCGALVFSPVLADTYWSDSAPASVTDLLNADYWSNGAPVTADNPGFITGQTITVSSNFDPGTEGQVIDLTFNGNNSTSMSGRFVPLANLASNKAGSVTFRLADTANVYVSGNFWGGTNDNARTYNDYNLFQYYGGNSTFSSNEWWSGMTAKTKIIISDNAVVTARGGSYSGLGWDDSSFGSVIDMTDNAALSVSSNNLDFRGDGTKLNMYDNSTVTSKILNITSGQAQVNLFDKAKISATDINISSSGALTLSGDSTLNASNTITVSNTGNIILNGNSAISANNMFKLDNQSVLTANDNAKLTVTKDAALDRDGAITVNDNAQLTFGAQLKIGDVNAGSNGGAVFNQTGGKVTVASNTFFSYHKDATVNLSGGEFICNNAQLYVTDQRGCTADIAMSGSAYLQAKDLRLSQHGHTNLTMTGNSQIKVTDLNMAYNYAAGDNAVSVVTMDGSSNITANNMYFFGSNVNGAAYGSLTLNDNASVIIANETQVGKGSTISLIDGKNYAAEITLNGNSEFTSRTYTATAGAKSQTTVNGSATFNSDAIDIGPESEFNINGGSVNLITLVNAGTVNLAGGAVNLNQYGLITSTDGTFNANGGAINLTTPSNVSSGDQVIVGLFSDVNTANSVADKTVVPEGWQTSVTTVNDKGVVVANYGSAPAGEFKVWKENASGSMGDDSNWEGDFSNPTGFVISGTNSLSGITGKTIIVDGTNTLSGTTPTGASLVISGGTANYNNAVIEGNVFVNGGTFNNNGRMDIGLNASNDGKASFTQTGGTVTVSGLTFFACHADAAVSLSGGKYIANGDQLYVTDQRGCKADIAMSGNAYLQAKDLRLSQHGTTNLNMSGDSHLKVTAFNLGYNYSAGDNVETVITMSDNSKLETGNFVSFAGNNDRNHSGAAYASFTMTDNAYVYASGNTWGGSNDGSNVAGLVSGKTYNLEMTFKGNSYFSTGEFWMAMAGKVHVTIEDNATVIARSGSSGLGWCEKTDGSLLEIKGGTLQIDSSNFLIGHTSTNANTGRSNVQQTGGTAIYKIIEIRHKDSGYYISGDNSVMTSGSVSTVAGSTLSIAGGTVNIGTLTNDGTLDLSGGTLNIGEGGITASGSYAVNLSGGVISTNGASWATSENVNATVADNSTVTFEPEAGQTIKWSGALVNSSQNAQIVKSGNGTLKIDSPDQNNPSKLDSFVVNAGELDFKGYFVGDIEVENGSVMSPGNSIGTLYETGNFNLDPGATLVMEIAGSSVDDNDQLIVTGDINIGTGSIIDVVLAAGSSLAGNDSFSAKLTSTNAGAIIDDVMGALSSYYFKDLNYEYNSEGGYYQITGILDANAVPEPSTWALLVLGVVGLLYWRKRNRK
ncbi:MAG: PEP-CTERM sorting domain-containing protein [Thermoguttaceae bacterium]|nr:PEP-CTERM sorting domain-containing protein [Thermoguttaceae bacterium]